MATNKIGRTIQQIRDLKNLSQGKLAEEAGYSTSYISQIERGLKIPSFKALTNIADALGEDVTTFLNIQEDHELDKTKLLLELQYTAAQTKQPEVIRAMIHFFNSLNDMKSD